jgi:hypothetical protein
MERDLTQRQVQTEKKGDTPGCVQPEMPLNVIIGAVVILMGKR